MEHSIINTSIFFKQIGAKIAYHRRLQNLTQVQLARLINISPDTLGRIERGKYNNDISMSMLLNIVTGLQIDITLLFTFNEEERKVWTESEKVE